MSGPLMIGAGVGALTSLATGGNPLQGAIIGGATGGIGDKLGGIDGLTGLFDVGGTVASGANSLGGGAALMGGGANAGLLSAVPTALESGLTNAIVPGSLESGGMVMNELGTYIPAGSINSGMVANPAIEGQFINQAAYDSLNTPSFFDNASNFVTEGYNNLTPTDMLGLGIQGAQATQTPPTQPIQTPPMQTLPAKQPTIGQPLAINVQQPGVTFANTGSMQNQLTPEQRRRLGLQG